MKNVLARAAIVASVCLCLGGPRTALAQDEPKVLEGEEAFRHPSTQVVLKAAEHFRAGKIDAGMALYSASEQADWKKSTEKAELSALRKERAPDPKAFAEGGHVLSSGVRARGPRAIDGLDSGCRKQSGLIGV